MVGLASNLQYSCATIMSMLPENLFQFECWETLKNYTFAKKFNKKFNQNFDFSKISKFFTKYLQFLIFLIVCDRTHVWDATHTFKIFLGSKLTLVGFSKVYPLKTHILTENLTF